MDAFQGIWDYKEFYLVDQTLFASFCINISSTTRLLLITQFPMRFTQ